MLGVQPGTIYNWFALPQPGKKITVMVPQWFDIVRSMTWESLKQRAAFKPAFFEPFNEVVKDTDTVRDQLEWYNKHKGDRIVLSAYNSEINTATKKALRAKHDNIVIQLGNRNQTALKSRPVKYKEADELVAKTISERWAMGDPISRPELYMELDEAFTEGTPFFSQFLDPEKEHAVQQRAKWLTTTLERQGWSIRKRSVSQKVPEDWYNIAIECSEDVLDQCEAAGIEHLVNADQTFMNFYHESDKVIAPRGAKRV